MQNLNAISALFLSVALGSAQVLACENDLTKPQSKFVDEFYSCQQKLGVEVASAMKCYTVLANDLAVFEGHAKQMLLLSDFYYASGLIHTAMGYPQRALRDFKASAAIEPRLAVREKLAFWEERADWDKETMVTRAQGISIKRINILRNPKIKDRVLEPPATSTMNARGEVGLPDRDARNVIFDEANLRNEINLAGYDELDQDMLFMKAARLSETDLITAYQSQYEPDSLKILSRRAKHYYGLGK